MGMKTILIPTETDAAMQSTLSTALLLAQRCSSYMEGFPLRFGINEFATIDFGGAMPLETFKKQSLEETQKAREMFESFMREHNVPRSNGANTSVSYGWFADAGEGEDFVGNYGRVFDVTVLSRPSPNNIGMHSRAIESGLFESGRPILLSPPTAPKQIASNIMVHWNGSTEQARATAFAMPLLQQAQRVILLTVTGGQGVPGPTSAQLLKHLQRNGITAEQMNVELSGRSTGEAVLAAAKAEGCDLLVKGAYTQSRLRQLIFGGATSHILANAELPVLMAH